MSQKINYTVTAKKIVTPDNKVMNYPSGKSVLIADEDVVVIDLGSDSLILTKSGFQITAQISISDLATDLSATDSTGS